MTKSELQGSGKAIHGRLRHLYGMWENLQEEARSMGYEFDEKTAELKGL